jgi:hypothetical protein
MSEFRLSPEAEAELDEGWIHVARERRSIEIVAGDYVIIHRVLEDGVVLILHVAHGGRDIALLFGS